MPPPAPEAKAEAKAKAKAVAPDLDLTLRTVLADVPPEAQDRVLVALVQAMALPQPSPLDN